MKMVYVFRIQLTLHSWGDRAPNWEAIVLTPAVLQSCKVTAGKTAKIIMWVGKCFLWVEDAVAHTHEHLF